MVYQKKPRISKIIANYTTVVADQEHLFDVSKEKLSNDILFLENTISRIEDIVALRSLGLNPTDKGEFKSLSFDFAKNQISSIFNLEIELIKLKAQLAIIEEVYNKYF